MTTASELGQEALEVKDPDPDDTVLWSVTTIISALDKPALKYWAAEEAANAAIDSEATWKAMLEDRGRDEAVKWIRDAMNRRPKTKLKSADLGAVVHKVCEHYALTGEKPWREFVEELVFRKGGDRIDIKGEATLIGTMLNQFDTWLARFQPSYQATEVCVYSPRFGYAGQADSFLTIDGPDRGVKFLGDYKTSREPYDSKGQPKTPYPNENALQLAAYRNAEFAAVWRPRRYEKQFRRYYALSATEREMAVPVPEVDTGLVILITPQACTAFPMDCGQEVHTAFLYTLEAFRWIEETSKRVMGDPLR